MAKSLSSTWRVMALVVFAISCLLTMRVSAKEVTSAGVIYNVDEIAKVATVKESLQLSHDITVKSIVKVGSESYPVTEISEKAFADTDCVSVKLPDSIVKIGDKAFYACPYLKTINVPASLKEVGSKAFGGGTTVQPEFGSNVTVANDVYDTDETVTDPGNGGEEEGKGNEGDEDGDEGNLNPTDPSGENADIVDPNPSDTPVNPTSDDPAKEVVVVTEKNIVKVTEVTKVTEVAPKATDVVDSFSLNGSTYTLYTNGTAILTKVSKGKKSLYIPATVKYQSKTYKVSAIADNAAKSCKKLSKVTIGKNVKTIGNSAFEGCKKIAKVDLKKVTTIGKRAFFGCKKLQTVKGKKVKSVGAKAFKKTNKKLNVSKLFK